MVLPEIKSKSNLVMKSSSQMNISELHDDLNLLNNQLYTKKTKNDSNYIIKRPPNLYDLKRIEQLLMWKVIFNQHKGFQKNIIIVDGATINKNDIYNFKSYFDKISNGKDTVSIKDFLNSFSRKPHMKRVKASLFNFIDADGDGLFSLV